MSSAPQKRILVLDGATMPTSARPGPVVEVCRADSALEAARLLVTRTPDAILARLEIEWHRGFLEAIPDDRRPAVIETGGAPQNPLFTDEWLSPTIGAEELASRLHLGIQRATARRRATRRAWTDALTGLPNRRAVVQALARASSRARRSTATLSLVLLDLDGFKRVNDTQGHLAGDRLLRRVGAALGAAVRADELCGRIGGDEFALILNGDQQAADQAARRITAVVRALGLSVTTAVGVYDPAERLQELYRRTDDVLRDLKARRHLTLTNADDAAGEALVAATGARWQRRLKLRVQPVEPETAKTRPGSPVELHLVEPKPDDTQ